MSNFFEKESRQTIIKIALFISVVTIIILFFPKDKKFKYRYEIGKPWTYELVTASFDFPIYKTEEQLEIDKQELLKNYTPIFEQDSKTVTLQLKKWEENWEKSRNGVFPLYKEYVERKFHEIYKRGIISSANLERLQKENLKGISIVNNERKIEQVLLEDIFTPKTAYEELILNKPLYIDGKELNSYNLNLFFTENLQYDSITSKIVKDDLIKNLSLTSGMVQIGERIIDRGEIVTPETYAILNSMKIESQQQFSLFKESGYVLLSEIIIVFGFILLLVLYLYLFRPTIFDSLKNLVFIAILILFIVILATIVVKQNSLAINIIPYALVPIIIRVFFDSRTALFVHLIIVLIISLIADNSYNFIILQIVAGMTAVSGLKDLTSRSQLTQTALYILISYVLTYLALELYTEGDIMKLNFHPLLHFGISSALLLFAYVLIYILEKIFGLISSVTLVELTNVNSDLMIKFAEIAPGTFQHSLQVSNLATEAAKKIGANSLLVRTGALYHDIGKMNDPLYFIENQSDGNNPLLNLGHVEAAQKIIKHVTDGIGMAKKHHLPEQIIGFIATHHGRSVTKYFYNSFANENPTIAPDVEKFMYPGPIPYSKETAILMMADAVEARSRTLTVYTEESIANMVEVMIDSQISDGQFKDAPISFKDVETVKKVLTEKVKNIYHGRITYPEIQNNEKI